MKLIRFIVAFYKLLRQTVTDFIDDDAIRLSASLSFFTIFAAAPVIIIIISLSGIFLGLEAVQGKIYGQINGLVGSGAAMEIQDIIKNIQTSHHGPAGAAIGFIILLTAATGVFIEIQESIDYIWSVKAKHTNGWIRFLKSRLMSFSLIISLGFILLISLIISSFLDVIDDRLMSLFPRSNILILYLLNSAFIFIVITCLFVAVFKVMPHASVKWRVAVIGGCFTSVLFLMGKYLISLYITHSPVSTTYGAAASLVIILLWVYYSSIILYLGAEFTKLYAQQYGGGIKLQSASVFIIKQEAKEISAPTSTVILK